MEFFKKVFKKPDPKRFRRDFLKQVGGIVLMTGVDKNGIESKPLVKQIPQNLNSNGWATGGTTCIYTSPYLSFSGQLPVGYVMSSLQNHHSFCDLPGCDGSPHGKK
jgi:hypothetical protein